MSSPEAISDVDVALQQAVASHKAGQFAAAETTYRAVIGTEPGHPVANHNLGILMMQVGQIKEGLTHLRCALKSDDCEALYYLSYARGLLVAGNAAEAGAILRWGRQRGLTDGRFDALQAQIEALSEDAVENPYATARRHLHAGQFDAAVTRYRQAIEAAPGKLDAYEGLAVALESIGEFAAAAQAYRGALAISPDNPILLDNLGSALLELDKIEEAIPLYEKALAIAPDFADAHFHLGMVLSQNGRVAEGFAHYMLRAALVYGTGKAPTDEPDPQHKVKHDLEQRDYLAGGKASPGDPYVPDMFRLADGARIEGPAINPANGTDRLLEDWRRSWPQPVVVDDFLTPPALEKLHAYCAGSTVWRKIYPDGYLGAAPEDGFACPLLAQIVEEVQATFRPILQGEKFRYLGAFKYDSDACAGTNTHADRSAVDVNFYITPDEANLDPQHGGAELFDLAAPNVEAQQRYSSDETAVRDLLKRSGAKSTIIPYRANRAVIFKSALFHRSDPFKFKSDYLSRRINVDMHFGDMRQDA